MNAFCNITLFGGLRIEQAERPIIRFRTYKTAALLAYLAFYRGMPHSREVLSGLLWPDAEGGRLSLRVALGSLRRQLEPPSAPHGSILIATRACVQLNFAAVCTDVSEFEAALRAAAVAAPNERAQRLLCAIELYRGELLPGYYEDWIGPERERLAEANLGALHQLCSLLETAEDLNAALDCAHRAVIAAPFQEEGYVVLMRLYWKAGRTADALHQYAELKRALKDSLDESPSLATQRLATEIREAVDRPPSDPSKRTLRPSKWAPLGDRSIGPDAFTSRHSLPPNFTRCFGRECEIARLKLLLSPPESASPTSQRLRSQPRLITITGPGGIGKTRLAIETARSCSDAFEGCVIFVSLADLADARLIPDAIVNTLGINRAAQVDSMEHVIQALSASRALLILDNLEHLLTENLPTSLDSKHDARSVIEALLFRSPDLTCLVTSRQPLEIECEIQFPVSLLPVPVMDDTIEAVRVTGMESGLNPMCGPRRLMTLPSVQMFVDRAQYVQPDFQLTSRNGFAVAALCARLEGMPLAIELAAAWAQSLTPAQMLSDLASDTLLVSRRKDRPQRQLSLRAAIEWSFQLLSREQRGFFVRLSVFVGGWSLDAAIEICQVESAVTALGDLRARSMIVAEEAGDTMRYRLLESLRHYAASQITKEERESLALRHAQYYLRLAERAEIELVGPCRQSCIDRLTAEQGNLRAALEWGRSTDVGIRLAGALRGFWEIRGEATEGRRWLTRALAGVERTSSIHARALYGAGSLAAIQGDLGEALPLAEASWALYQELNEQPAAAAAGTLLSKIYYALGEHQRAGTLLEQSLHFCRQCGDVREMAAAMTEQGRRHGFNGDYGPAETCLAESRTLYENIGDVRGLAQVVYEQAIIQQYRQDFAAAHAFYQQMLTLCRDLGDPVGTSAAMYGIGYIARLQGDYAGAAVTLEDCLSLQRQLVLKQGIALTLRNLGCIARDQGEYERATALFEEALRMGRECCDSQMVAETLGSMGVLALHRGDYEDARRLHEECLHFRRASDYKQDIGESLLCLAVIALAENHPERARTHLAEALVLFQEVGSPVALANTVGVLSLVALQQGRSDEAEAYGRESLTLLKRSTAQCEVTAQLEQMARVRHALGDRVRAARLLGASELLRTRIGHRRIAFYQLLFEDQISALRTELEAGAFAAAWSYGADMTLEQAVEYALEIRMHPCEPVTKDAN